MTRAAAPVSRASATDYHGGSRIAHNWSMGSLFRRRFARRLLVGAGATALVLAGTLLPGLTALAQVGGQPGPGQPGERRAPTEPNDPGFELQWGLDNIGAAEAWPVTTGEGVTVAVVDSGADLAHEDLADQIVAHVSCLDTDGLAANCDAASADAGADDDGHGTHVAGIIGAEAGNGVGVAGVAPGADLMIIRALEHTCPDGAPDQPCTPTGTGDDVAAGIRWATANGADVINLSIGSSAEEIVGPAFGDALRYAWNRGVIAVVAAGNDVLQSGFRDEPAIVVGALNRGSQAAQYSNGVGEAQWAVSAPGGESDTEASCAAGGEPQGILSTYWDPDTDGSDYACLAGTSMAAPHVAGAAALLLGAGLRPHEAVEFLLNTADDLGLPGSDTTYGAGALNLPRAVAVFVPQTGSTGSTSTSPGTGSGTGTGNATTAPSTTLSPSVPPLAGGPAPSPEVSDPSGQRGPQAQLASANRPSGFLRGVLVSLAAVLAVVVWSGHAWARLRTAGWARPTSVKPE